MRLVMTEKQKRKTQTVSTISGGNLESTLQRIVVE